MKKNKHQKHEPLGQLGRIFQFSRDDLAANRAGYMTPTQQFGFKFWERKVFGWILSLPPLKWLKPRKILKITGKAKKQFSSRIVITGGGGGSSGGGQDVLEKRHIQILASNETVSFYVNAKQYNALPENIELTLYYDPIQNRIVSVEPPYLQE